MVVLPEPVPPEMTMFMRQAPAILSAVAILYDIEPKSRSMSIVIGFSENLRIEIAVPRSESGGKITLTRLPSLRCPSARGWVGPARPPHSLPQRCDISEWGGSWRNWLGEFCS